MVKLNEGFTKLLKHRHIPSPLIDMKSFEVKQFIKEIKYKGTNGFSKTVSKKMQLDHYKETLENPLSNGYVYCISSEYNTQRASYVAFEIIVNAIDEHMQFTGDKGDLPIWHYVIGGFKDKFRDRDINETPALIVLDGCYKDASDIKIEKARDILELYYDIPRIILTTGIDPLTFMYERMYSPVNRVLHLGTSKHINM